MKSCRSLWMDSVSRGEALLTGTKFRAHVPATGHGFGTWCTNEGRATRNRFFSQKIFQRKSGLILMFALPMGAGTRAARPASTSPGAERLGCSTPPVLATRCGRRPSAHRGGFAMDVPRRIPEVVPAMKLSYAHGVSA